MSDQSSAELDNERKIIRIRSKIVAITE